MAIPDYQSCMLPLLEFFGDQNEHSLRETIDHLATHFKLTNDELKQLLPSGQQAVFDNRVAWARTYLKQAGLLEPTRRGYLRITPRGLEILKQKPEKINVKFLEQFKEFREFRKRKRKPQDKVKENNKDETQKTPAEALEEAYEDLGEDLAKELLQQIKKCPPSLFEKIVVELLVKMGYGGSRKDAGQAIGRSGDEGIDGIIKEDKLGLDIIYIQAKRWENTVSRPEIQKFAGALQGQRARKGIFITTSNFSREATEYVTKIDTKIILIDGEQLAQFMIDNDVGVSPVAKYEVKKLDLDYFTDE
ncbi:MAG: restriction endonuclease [Deltaproteobacteria bacterium]|nr:restriction endonuclease [Deltaproteobacteria bacterium]